MEQLFSTPINTAGMTRLKWELEQNQRQDGQLLCCGTADMDFLSPQPIRDAICTVAQRGHLGYHYEPDGYFAAIENWLMRLCGWRIDARAATSYSMSVYTAAYTVIQALAHPGDEIIIQTPVHFCFQSTVLDCGCKLVMSPLQKNANNRYQMDFAGLEALITERTRFVWICNPHNPVGRAWSREELQRLADICTRHGVTILSDDVYNGLLFPSVTYTPIGSITKDSITLYSASKIYNTTGLKHAIVVTENPEYLVKYKRQLEILELDYGINLFGVAGCTAAFDQCDDWVKALMAHIAANQALVHQTITEKLPTIRCTVPDATYFSWLDFSGYGMETAELARLFEQEAHLVVCFGDSLGAGGDRHVRLNLACTREMLEHILERIVKTFASYER